MSSNGPSGSNGGFDFSSPYGGYGPSVNEYGGYGPGTASPPGPGGGPSGAGAVSRISAKSLRDWGVETPARVQVPPEKKKVPKPGEPGYELTEEGKAAAVEKRRRNRSLLTGYEKPSVKRRELGGFGTEESTQLY